MVLTKEQLQFYEENGYIVIPRHLCEETVDSLRSSMHDIVHTFDPSTTSSIFSTSEQDRKSDEYFLNSSYDVRFFWEERAWKDGQLIVDPHVAINKVGHGLHDLVPAFQKVSYNPEIGSICRDLGMKLPLAVQSMYIFKQAHVGGEVGAHQDGTFLYTEPQTCIGFWWALDDCTTENGCLWAVPGSHRIGVARHFRRKANGEGTEFEPKEPVEFDISNAVPLEIPKGSLVILHGALVHYSAANHSDKARHAYSIHIVDGSEGIVYPSNNWLQRPKEHPFNAIPAISE